MARRRKKAVQGKSYLEAMFAAQLRAENLYFEEQVKLVPGRKFAADFFLPQLRLVIEIQGGTYIRGRHNRPEGFRADCEKNNLLTLLGYRVFKADVEQVKKGTLLQWVKQAQVLFNVRPIARPVHQIPPETLNRAAGLILEHKKRIGEP